MAEAKEGLACPITYEELRDLEKDFEDVETEISKSMDNIVYLSLFALFVHRPKTICRALNH